ncbi:MAG: sigma-70 family RNA polymerase sigma factor [Actinomycetaceae bacterium]|nr:sigma-70 family RNA polymerase sigma factor [Actinomycetaceae bacterium]
MNTQEREALIVDNLPLVGYHVSEMLRRVPSHVQREDLAAAGSLALVQAAHSFDPSQGVPFHKYAAFRVRGAMVDELRGMDWASRGVRQRAKQLEEVQQTLMASSGRVPTREELASALGCDVAQVEAIQHDVNRKILSIDGSEEYTAIQIVDPEMGPEDRVLTDERQLYLHAAVAALPERLRYVVQETYFKDRQVSELAEELDVTQSRVSQLRSEALALMRDGMSVQLDGAVLPEAKGVAQRRRVSYCEEVGRQARLLAQASGIELSAEDESQAAAEVTVADTSDVKPTEAESPTPESRAPDFEEDSLNDPQVDVEEDVWESEVHVTMRGGVVTNAAILSAQSVAAGIEREKERAAMEEERLREAEGKKPSKSQPPIEEEDPEKETDKEFHPGVGMRVGLQGKAKRRPVKGLKDFTDT